MLAAFRRCSFARGFASSAIPLHLQKVVVKMAVDAFDDKVSKYTTLPAQFKVPPSPDLPLSMHGSWVNISTFREAYRKQKLAPEVVEALNKVGFIWDVRQHKWEMTVQGLRTYSNLHNHVIIPRTFVVPHGDERWPKESWNWKLGRVVDNLRQDKDKLAQDRIATLDSLGFVWSVHAQEWQHSIDLLATYTAIYGHANVPYSYVVPCTDEWPASGHGMRLGVWVQNIRNRAASYSKARVAALNELGFVWGVHDENWQVNVHALRTYKMLHGHVNVPKRFVTTDEWPQMLRGLHLGAFVHNSRSRMAALDPRHDELMALGVDFKNRHD
ncbi:hypothetical protein DYB37_013367 [Aphanomyces astaci]|uniref:Helicase-associated domain-containing protein n=2 Tax=Aphanomyces astaci TaxID=112090 RepID=A0A3R6YH43_APHAT|nr:hypothetical protein DYB35_013238 [Aphanomyces astaci]RHZ30814.1 hypothetical protein DYB37_013367 [Aphanomyces astaci]